MATIRENLDRLRRIYPLRAATGQLYRTRAELPRRWLRIRLHTVMVSDKNLFRTHAALFKKKDGKTGAQWAAWLATNTEKIYTDGILQGLNLIDSSQTWHVREFIGWVGELEARQRKRKRVKRKPIHTKMASRRHKAKR